MKTFDLYGFDKDDVDVVLKGVEEALEVSFNEHDSTYRGIYYRWTSTSAEELILKRNFDDLEKEWAEEEFREHSILLYVDATMRCDEIQKALLAHMPYAKLLRRDKFED